ncbi:MAG: hypothetical protein HOJ57_29450 [Lentisphaerae bacterium]|jgi:hypothetical protein|nr:hypothetical protein [Lentisphaerota bacterium]MBT5610103.1 hypothetical protein [Lentisphaerota bacterium]
MADTVTGERIREVLIEVVDEFSKQGPGYFQEGAILREAATRLGIRRQAALEQALLTAWHDQFREGQLAWGFDLDNPNAPFCHVTTKGRETLANMSRDPANADGYMGHLRAEVTLNAVADSYIAEALETYNTNCFKATAVMVGCAAESLTLELRDTLVARMKALGKTVPKKLTDWRIRTVTMALKAELDSQKSAMDVKLREAHEAYWPAFTQQIRAVRNEAGHPISVNPVTDRAVHASLLIFPELAVLTDKLRAWMGSTYS